MPHNSTYHSSKSFVNMFLTLVVNWMGKADKKRSRRVQVTWFSLISRVEVDTRYIDGYIYIDKKIHNTGSTASLCVEDWNFQSPHIWPCIISLLIVDLWTFPIHRTNKSNYSRIMNIDLQTTIPSIDWIVWNYNVSSLPNSTVLKSRNSD